MKAKAQFWTMKTPSGRLVPVYAAYRRRDAIDKLCENLWQRWTWKHLYRTGWRAVRVNVRES